MDARARVLVVEDIAIARESYVANLELSDRYRVDGVGTHDEAVTAINRCAYDVAVLDIMLAGPRDVANREGVDIARRIQHLAEGTRVVMLSAQEGDTELVGDLVQDYGVYKYLAKATLERDGVGALLDTVERAVKGSNVSKPSWDSLVGSLVPGRLEQEFVSEVMGHLDFNGGFEHLNRTLVHAARHLVPLLSPCDPVRVMQFDELAQVFHGIFWSKGQGQAVEMRLEGRATTPSQVSDLPSLEVEPLLDREKAGLRVVVIARPDLPRTEFKSRFRDGEEAN